MPILEHLERATEGVYILPPIEINREGPEGAGQPPDDRPGKDIRPSHEADPPPQQYSNNHGVIIGSMVRDEHHGASCRNVFCASRFQLVEVSEEKAQ
jgi:hypothetical protein